MSAPDSDVATKSSPQTTGKKTHQQQQKGQQQPREPRPPRGEGGGNKGQQSGLAEGVQKDKQQNRGQQGGSNEPKSGFPTATKSVAPAIKQVGTIKSTTGGAPRLALFDHLPRKQPMVDPYSMEGESSLHPATIKLGLLYRTGTVYSDDDRVVALLAAFTKVIEDYKTPPNKQLSWDLDKHIRAQVQHLVHCRQHSMGMGNVIKYIRYEISHIPPECSEAEAKAQLNAKLQSFLEERIVYARESIVRYMSTTIKDDDVILTFGSSPLLRQVLLKVAGLSHTLSIQPMTPLYQHMLLTHAINPFYQHPLNTLSTHSLGLPSRPTRLFTDQTVSTHFLTLPSQPTLSPFYPACH